MMTEAITEGCHHVGLTVPDLEKSARFFVDLPGWNEVRRDDSYPAIFVSDGEILVTLWQAKADSPLPFDRHGQIGLHHLALKVSSETALEKTYERLSKAPDVRIEFAPELLRQGPAKHMMCYEPGGIRIEFIWPGPRNPS